jgi:hypothetical protein
MKKRKRKEREREREREREKGTNHVDYFIRFDQANQFI